MLDRHAREAGALLPDQLVAFAFAAHDLAPATGKDQDALSRFHQRRTVFRRPQDHAVADQQISPEGHIKVKPVAQSAQHHVVLGVEVLDHQRCIHQPEQGVVTNEQRGPREIQFPQTEKLRIEPASGDRESGTHLRLGRW